MDPDEGTSRCNRPDCGRGVIEDGFCSACGLRPLAQILEVPPERRAAPRGLSIGVANVRPDPWYGLDLTETGHLPEAVDVAAPAPGPLAEKYRFCGNPACGQAVGRGQDGRPGRTVGYCPNCATAFDFSQPDSLVIAGRYAVRGYLAAGSYGTTLLAHDRNLATDVVLKKLNNSAVASTAQGERNALVGLRHDSIVRILGYETEGPHLVLEHIPGEPLAARPGDRLEFLLAHGLRILQALDYLHARGLLHCDVKPQNIVRFKEETSAGSRDRVRLIDFGSVRTSKDTGPVTAYTSGYAPATGDREHTHPTPGFDLYGLGETLREVCRQHLRERTSPGVDSLHLLLARATDDAGPKHRFVSARQFGEQLSGVVRQVVAAAPVQHQVSRPSALFGSMSAPLHGGLGAARPLAHWVTAAVTEDAALTLPPPFSPPAPSAIAVALPTPLSDPYEPGVVDSAEAALAESRLALRRGDADHAHHALHHSGLPSWHWLHSWYSGLIDLARQNVAESSRHFTAVRAALPGELIPQLALGLCAELEGDPEVAESQYGMVFDTSPALGAAGFGLARVHSQAGRRTDAVATAERLAQEFRYEREARVAAVRLLVTVPGAERPSSQRTPAAGEPAESGAMDADTARARELLDQLAADPATAAALDAEIQDTEYLSTHNRLALSESVRRLGPHAATARDYVALVDLANQLRPPLQWRGPRRRSGTRQSRFGGTTGTLVS
ncbi:tetratricopeptide repeat protein [Streptomyces sp. CA-111067]|uniref:tetratricopeptide repeat protein n=1 Tax=Streptomyces sp. CA-111067 TaxID=3240046 RepID=UPI003D965C62